MPAPHSPTYSLIIHGGAGKVGNNHQAVNSIRSVIMAGEALLAAGSTAVDVVEHCVRLLEDDPHFNAGRGSVLNHEGGISMDASIMNGINLKAGAVAGVSNIKNPVRLARHVMDESRHVLLIGRGAEAYARHHRQEFADDDYFITEMRRQQWQAALKLKRVVLDHSEPADAETEAEQKYGTVGAVARDTRGDLAAATSTGGVVNKLYGRVGDSPVIGAGVYAENHTCAVSATGYGEQFLRTVLAKHAADIIRFQHAGAQTAAIEAIQYLVSSVQGRGGLILIDHDGNIGKAYSTPGMINGFVTAGQPIFAGLD